MGNGEREVGTAERGEPDPRASSAGGVVSGER